MKAKDASDFKYDPKNWEVTQKMKEAFKNNGFVIVRNMLSQPEMKKLQNAVNHSKGITTNTFTRYDEDGKATTTCLWNHPGRDITGVLARTRRVVDTAEQLMGGDEMYHYHSKMVMKEPKKGGAFEWHQDYGYWYLCHNLYPDMMSVFIPVDDCDMGNGCLQVLAGSHRFGRVDHVTKGNQLAVEPGRLEQALKKLELVEVEMKTGDILFFHCNTFHTSSQNLSDRRRWAFIIAYNKKSNNPYKEHHHPLYTPLVKADDSDLLACDVIEDLEDKWFMKSDDDKHVRGVVH